jgi:seryl-tRNA synthetase
MHDIKYLRSNTDAFITAMMKRNLTDSQNIANSIIDLDREIRSLQTTKQELRQQRSQISQQVGLAFKANNAEQANNLKQQVATIKDDLNNIEQQQQQLSQKLHEVLASLPNIAHDSVPEGNDEADNVIITHHGQPRLFNNFSPQPHEQLLNFKPEIAAKISGSRFSWLEGNAAKLERALANFMLDTHVQEHGYREVSPPYLVKNHAMYGVGQLPKFAEDAFSLSQRDLWLIPTAEVSLTYSMAEAICNKQELPRRYVAHTPCFRSEAGSAGRDTTGLIRQHQFSKVELVSFTTADIAEAELEKMTRCAQTILEKLELPYRRVLLCAGDMGFSAHKTYDLEVWFPAQNKYREVSSCSWVADFQARRMNARYKDPELGQNLFMHTLNGSALAIGRTIAALVENYQQQDGSFAIPQVLQAYM